jgi:hypothetical protein
MHRNSENGQHLLIKFSERSDLDDPCPNGRVNGNGKKMHPFSLFFIFLSKRPLLRAITISRRHAEGFTSGGSMKNQKKSR